MKKLLALLLVLVMLLSAGTAFAAATPDVYKVEDQNGNVIYLFGTMHMVRNDIYESEQPFGPALEEAYAYADILAVEVDVTKMLEASDDPEAQQAQMMEMYYTDGTTVFDHGVSEEILLDMSEMLGIPAEMLAGIKLSNWASFLLFPLMQELNLNAENGADAWVLQRAYADGKQVVELESEAEQNRAIATMSDELALYNVEKILEDPASSVDGMELMYNAWITGDTETLKEALDDENTIKGMDEELAKDLNEHNATLNANRDEEFFKDAVGFLERGEKVLIAIGAAHIIGDTGLVNSLTDAGYTVTKIS